VRTAGKDRVLFPVENTWDSFFLADVGGTDEFMQERASQDQSDREPF
jgi:antitoxin VapB